MKLDRAMVQERIREAKQPTYRASELAETIDVLSNRLYVHDFAIHRQRIDEAKRFLRQHYGGLGAIDATLIDLAAECFLAGICEADGEPYVPANARIGALLVQVKERMVRAATPEGEDLRAPQANGENGVTGA